MNHETMVNLNKSKAVAIEYGSKNSPSVIAKGEGEIAKAIIRYAEENGIWITQNSNLVALLSRIDVEHEIPPELYKAVAVILAWVYWLKKLDINGKTRG
jgi:flagellar biosynthesis protein